MFGPSPRAWSWRSDCRTRSIPSTRLASRKDSGRQLPRTLPVSRSTAWLVRTWNTSPGGKKPQPSLIVESPTPRKPLGRTPRMLLSLIGMRTSPEGYPVASGTAAGGPREQIVGKATGRGEEALGDGATDAGRPRRAPPRRDQNDAVRRVRAVQRRRRRPPQHVDCGDVGDLEVVEAGRHLAPHVEPVGIRALIRAHAVHVQ